MMTWLPQCQNILVMYEQQGNGTCKFGILLGEWEAAHSVHFQMSVDARH